MGAVGTIASCGAARCTRARLLPGRQARAALRFSARQCFRRLAPDRHRSGGRAAVRTTGVAGDLRRRIPGQHRHRRVDPELAGHRRGKHAGGGGGRAARRALRRRRACRRSCSGLFPIRARGRGQYCDQRHHRYDVTGRQRPGRVERLRRDLADLVAGRCGRCADRGAFDPSVGQGARFRTPA